MTAIEIIALLVAISAILKTVMFFFNMDFMMKITKWFMKCEKILMGIYILITALALYFLLQEMSIVQIMATSVVGLGLMGVVIAPMAPDMMKSIEKSLKKSKGQFMIGMLVWVGLSVWVLFELFGKGM